MTSSIVSKERLFFLNRNIIKFKQNPPITHATVGGMVIDQWDSNVTVRVHRNWVNFKLRVTILKKLRDFKHMPDSVPTTTRSIAKAQEHIK